MSIMCDRPPAFSPPKRRKMNNSATVPATMMNVPAIKTTISAR